jgi:hypothetical protein
MLGGVGARQAGRGGIGRGGGWACVCVCDRGARAGQPVPMALLLRSRRGPCLWLYTTAFPSALMRPPRAVCARHVVPCHVHLSHKTVLVAAPRSATRRAPPPPPQLPHTMPRCVRACVCVCVWAAGARVCGWQRGARTPSLAQLWCCTGLCVRAVPGTRVWSHLDMLERGNVACAWCRCLRRVAAILCVFACACLRVRLPHRRGGVMCVWGGGEGLRTL